MKYLIVFSLFASLCFLSSLIYEAEAKSTRQISQVTSTPSPEDLLLRLKVYQYAEKLKAKENKKLLKAEKKKAKEAAFTAYLTSALNSANAAATSSAASSPAVAPPMPMIPALGLWKKSFLMAAAAQAAATGAQTTAAPKIDVTTDSAAAESSEDETDDTEAEDAVINQIVKRYAPMVRDKFYGKGNKDHYYDSKKKHGHKKSKEDDESEESEEDGGKPDTDSPTHKSGAFNRFGTGPFGSPNGVGYEDAKVNQAGCSGNHIHICSGTTVYLTNPEDDAAADLINSVDENVEDTINPVQPEADQDQKSDEEDEEDTPKHQKKHGHKKH